MVKYKQLCILCKKNKVLMQGYKQKPICSPCQMKSWDEVTDPKYKELFNLPKETYEQSYFLRSVRDYYDKAGRLSEKQIQAFKKTSKEIQEKPQ